MEVRGQLRAAAALSSGKVIHGTQWIEGCVCSTAGLDSVEQRKVPSFFEELNSDRPQCSPSLSWPCYPLLLQAKYFFLISRKFTIYSTNGTISKYVVRKHLCGAIIQWWVSYIYCALCCVCLYSSSSLWSFKSEGHCRFSLRLTFNGLLHSVT
jgi:hypothetical protein